MKGTLASADFTIFQAELTRTLQGSTDQFMGGFFDIIIESIELIYQGIQESIDATRQIESIRAQGMGIIQQGNQLFGQVPTGQGIISNSVASEVVNLAEQWDGQHFNEGVFAQCAYFVREVFKQAGIELGVSADTMSSGDPRAGELGAGFASSLIGSDIGQVGRTSDPNAIPAGAIVGFTNTYGNFEQGAITHVGVSTGDGQMVDRSTRSAPVRERAISTFNPNASGEYIWLFRRKYA